MELDWDQVHKAHEAYKSYRAARVTTRARCSTLSPAGHLTVSALFWTSLIKGLHDEYFYDPVVTSMQIIPVAGHDSMLMNLSGAHAPFFTRNIVIIKDNAGHTGVGEIPGGRRSAKRWRMPFRWWWEKRWVSTKCPQHRAQYLCRSRCRRPRPATFDLRTTIHVVTGIEAAMLDLLGQHGR